MKVKYDKKLPAKASALIELALKDLTWVEQNPNRAFVDMSNYVERVQYSFNGKTEDSPLCAVCFAGAVMYRSMGIDFNVSWSNFPIDTQNKLIALDFFRQGSIVDGLRKMFGMEANQVAAWLSENDAYVIVPSYDDPKKFRKAMERIVRNLKKVGL